MATKNINEPITIQKLNIQQTTIRIIGDSPLIVHAWDEKGKRMMLEAQQGKAKGKKKPLRNPADDFVQAGYWISGKPEYTDDTPEQKIMELFDEAVASGARFGFPATAIKQAAQGAAYRLGWVKNQMGLRGAFFIEAEVNGLVEIHSDPPEMREDVVKINKGSSADLRYRPQFNNWWIDLPISYNASSEYTLDVIINAINAGGYVCGLGEWRPEKDGVFGMFHVAAQ